MIHTFLLGVASGNGQHEALTYGIRQHDDCSLLSQPITAYDLQVRYNKTKYHLLRLLYHTHPKNCTMHMRNFLEFSNKVNSIKKVCLLVIFLVFQRTKKEVYVNSWMSLISFTLMKKWNIVCCATHACG